MPLAIENTGSTARDFCMLERNLLSHYKLAILLALISSSILLRTRLSFNDGVEHDPSPGKGVLPIGTLEMVTALLAIGAGIWEYQSSSVDMRNQRAFLDVTKPHFALMTIVASVVLTACVILLADENLL
ncbi:hypothetical protein GLOTRDRAFT_40323 [Gloeophyllum trabeum ATCC 11539]|uniref:DUF202 domain-containing protein n=1 Tax=Gloeophyllum trabeum (strain ATCC 11539 / FP-39264 / Madison 617) TaxID=670483 RepID=S7Q9D0_GLOTA|nr:uncharacterized protein GLOTRDRAFT_40323 [Gloeophyllum trabeum ATCC 11539]EPQ56526.1 hypothetical protein GLOTRDRAFT_40323 [Gloeophyllum trabeum ATCC 11539]